MLQRVGTFVDADEDPQPLDVLQHEAILAGDVLAVRVTGTVVTVELDPRGSIEVAERVQRLDDTLAAVLQLVQGTQVDVDGVGVELPVTGVDLLDRRGFATLPVGVDAELLVVVKGHLDKPVDLTLTHFNGHDGPFQ